MRVFRKIETLVEDLMHSKEIGTQMAAMGAAATENKKPIQPQVKSTVVFQGDFSAQQNLGVALQSKKAANADTHAAEN